MVCAQVLLQNHLKSHHHERMLSCSRGGYSSPYYHLSIQVRVDTGSQTLTVVCMRPDREIGVRLSLVCVGLCV
jgi:hypothetical protein